MSHKSRLIVSIITLLFIAFMTMAVAAGRGGPLKQTGMGMPTDTMQPQPSSTAQATSTPVGNSSAQNMPGPTMTSIFTGYTPIPNSTYTGGTVMMGSCPGMSGMGCMGTMGGMGSLGTVMGSGLMTGTVGTIGMAAMDAGGMDMSSCAMMGSSGMSKSGMYGDSSMSGMNMSGNSSIMGMDMSGGSSYVEANSISVFSNPWLLLGWIVLGLMVVAILVAAGLGIWWLVRHSNQAHAS